VDAARTAERQRRLLGRADRPVLPAHVPDPRALAREDELQAVLEGEGDHQQLQPDDELQRLEPGDASPQPAEPDADLQLQLPSPHPVRHPQ
jgi:hypothetical protein